MCDGGCKCKTRTALSVDAPDGYETAEVSDAKTEVTDYFYHQAQVNIAWNPPPECNGCACSGYC